MQPPAADPACATCGGRVYAADLTAVRAFGQCWHADCFTCAHCRRPIGTGGPRGAFDLLVLDGVPQHDSCFMRLRFAGGAGRHGGTTAPAPTGPTTLTEPGTSSPGEQAFAAAAGAGEGGTAVQPSASGLRAAPAPLSPTDLALRNSLAASQSRSWVWGDASASAASAPPEDAAAHPGRWSVDRVCAWLDEQGLGDYKRNFQHAGVDGRSLLLLEKEDLRDELRVTILQDRKELWQAIVRLRDRYGADAGSAPGAARDSGADAHSVCSSRPESRVSRFAELDDFTGARGGRAREDEPGAARSPVLARGDTERVIAEFTVEPAPVSRQRVQEVYRPLEPDSIDQYLARHDAGRPPSSRSPRPPSSRFHSESPYLDQALESFEARTGRSLRSPTS